MIGLQPKEIAEEIVSYYDKFVAYDENIEVKNYELWHKRVIKLAIHEVEGLLSVSIGMECFYGQWREPGDYTTLKSVLEILNSKWK